MILTVAYISGREKSHLGWFLESLADQIGAGDEIHVLIVSPKIAMTGTPMPIVGVLDIESGRDVPIGKFASVRSVKPKPTIWQGQHRVTAQDWWAMSSARNTALCLCETPWIAFCDDRCVLERGWLDAARGAMEHEYVICGGYEKRHGMGGGSLEALRTSGTRVAIDNRWEASPDGNRNCGGQWLYGCTFALPLEWALTVNGFEEGCDGQSAEDYIFGMMLANRGYRIDYDPGMWVIQDRSPGQENVYRREDKGVSPNDKSHAALARFGGRARTEFTIDLRAVRAHLAGEPTVWDALDDKYRWPVGRFPIPVSTGWRDWFDDEVIDKDYPRPRTP